MGHRAALAAALAAAFLASGGGQKGGVDHSDKTRMKGGRVKGQPPKECIRAEWSYKTKNFIQGSATVATPAGLPAATPTIYVGSNVGSLFALKPRQMGKPELLWKFDTESYVRSTPAVGADGTVYFGGDDKHLYAVNPDGTLKWKFATEWIVCSKPAIAPDGTICALPTPAAAVAAGLTLRASQMWARWTGGSTR